MSCTSIVLAVIFIVILKILKDYFANVYNYWQKRGVKGPIPLPILGNSIPQLTRPAHLIDEERFKKYGRVYGTFEFSKPFLTIVDPNLIREVAIKQFHNFNNRYNRIPSDRLWTKTLAFAADDSWKTLRTYLSPVFTSRKMKRMFRYVDRCTDNTLQYIRGVGGEDIIVKDTMMSYTMDVIAKCAFGVDTNGYKDPYNEFLVKAQSFGKFMFWRLTLSTMIPRRIQDFHKSLEFNFLDNQTQDYFTNILTSIINDRRMNSVKKSDFVSLMLAVEESDDEDDSNVNTIDELVNEKDKLIDENNNDNTYENKKKKLSNEDMLAQALVFFVAGYETTSNLMNFTVYALAMNPDVQKKLYEEIMKSTAGKDKLDYDTVFAMTYLDAVINESLRMYPPVVTMDRVTTTDVILGDGEDKIKLDKGTIINLPSYMIQHDPKYYPDPYSFKPERFLPENKHLIEPYTFIPFGVGPRNCIGLRFALMTAKVFLTKLVQQFEIHKTANTPLQPKYMVVHNTMSSEPLRVGFTPREMIREIRLH